MEITEDKVFAAFGLSREEEAGSGQEEETADSAATEAGQDPESEARENTAEEQAPDGEPEQDEGEDSSEEHAPAQEQTPEERRANAARRRQQETQAAIDAAVHKALAERDRQQATQMEEFFKRASLSNPITGEPIRSMEEFEAWHKAQEEQRIRDELQEGKLTEETLSSLIDRHPSVQAMRQQQEQQRLAAEQAQNAAMEQEVERQLAEIRKTDPSIRTVADLMNRPYSKELYDAVRRGNNFEDAFYLATRKQKEEVTAQAAQQAAVNRMRGKEHLKTTSIGGKAGATVTPEEEEMYHLFNPKASAEEIQRYQNKYKK